MKDDDIVVIRQFDNAIDAHMIKGILETNDIHCFLSDENIISINPLYNQGLGGIKLHVFVKDIPEAEKILKEQQGEIGEEQLDKEQNGRSVSVKGPYCSSTDVDYGAATRNKFHLLTILVSLLLMVYPFAIKKRYHCFHCNRDFKTGDKYKAK